jgi:hypothetical protein
MILTEEEAKTKRCQEGFGPSPVQVPSITTHGDPHNPYGHSWTTTTVAQSAPVNCIGSACMAWRRWGAQLPDCLPFDLNPYSPLPEGAVALGYCGKAGKP